MSSINKNKYLSLTEKSFYKKLGKVTKIVGLTIESVGPDAKLNDLCGTMNIQKNLYLILTSVLSIIKRKASFHKRPLFFSSYIFYLRTARRYTTRETAAEMTSVIQKACHTKTPPPRWDSR